MTNKEFKALDRNDDGDICELYNIWNTLTDNQIDRLTGDDWQRLDLYREEIDYMMLEELA
tara:strand:+ start:202 stop:381 length:180 start_codon:yes stop_codon:yes gene_type:complete